MGLADAAEDDELKEECMGAGGQKQGCGRRGHGIAAGFGGFNTDGVRAVIKLNEYG